MYMYIYMYRHIYRWIDMILYIQSYYKKELHIANETYILKEPTNRSHPICNALCIYLYIYICKKKIQESKDRLYTG